MISRQQYIDKYVNKYPKKEKDKVDLNLFSKKNNPKENLNLFKQENHNESLNLFAKPEQEQEVIARLSNKQFNLLSYGYASIVVPDGVKMKHKSGSKQLHFTCRNRQIGKILSDALEADGIEWVES